MNIASVNSSTSAGNSLTALRSALRSVSNSSTSSAAQTPVQEANETKAQTQAEAAKGDLQAKLKLAREQTVQAAQQPAAVASTKNSLDAIA